MIFTERVKSLIKERGITQDQFNKDVDISKNTLSYWEKEGRLPKPRKLQEIADYFGVSVEYLTGEEDREASDARSTERFLDFLEKDQVVWWLSKFTKGDINNETFRRQIIDLLVNSVTVWDEPDGSYRIEYVVNLIFNRNRTIKSSDLACNGARQEDNPNYHKFGFLLFPTYTVATMRRTHPAP